MFPKLHTLPALVPSKPSSGTVIFLHGSGDSGEGIKTWIKGLLRSEAGIPHMRIVFPTAPLRPYTYLGGELSNVWFDRLALSPSAEEHHETINEMAEELVMSIKSEVAAGVPLNRIIIGGFSMGGAMAMHIGYRYLPGLAGVFALSSFLNNKSLVYEHLKKNTNEGLKFPPLYMCHGSRDVLVPPTWGKETHDQLCKLGVDVQFHVVRNAFHELTGGELKQLFDWISSRVPPI